MARKYAPMTKLKIKRIEKGLSQAELAEKVGLNKIAISNYEIGYRFPKKIYLDRIAAELDCEAGDLI